MAERNVQKEFQEKVLAYRILESRINALSQQRDLLTNKMFEIQTTLNSIDELEKSDEDIIFPVGSESYAYGKISDKGKMIVEIGAGVAMEKTFEEARSILKGRMADMDKALTTLERNMQEAGESLEILEPEIQRMAEAQQRQEDPHHDLTPQQAE